MNQSNENSESSMRGGPYISPRGKFKLVENPQMSTPLQAEDVKDEQFDYEYGGGYEHLAEKHGEEAARAKLFEMEQVVNPGLAATLLFRAEGGPNPMTVAHCWFGPNFPLWRHSHPRMGDCLYLVTAGELIIGTRRLRTGSCIFVPNGQPYKYTAGPVGCEVLEIRPGGDGEPDAAWLKVHENSLEDVDEIIRRAKAARHEWKRPEKFGDVALLQAEWDAKHGSDPRDA